MLTRSIRASFSRGRKILMPEADGNQKGARNRELGQAMGVADEKLGVLVPHRPGGADSPDHHVGHFALTGMMKRADSFEAANPPEKFADVVGAAPLAVADHIEPGEFLKADGKPDSVVECRPILCRGQGVPARQQFTDDEGPGKRPDDLRMEGRQFLGSSGLHGRADLPGPGADLSPGPGASAIQRVSVQTPAPPLAQAEAVAQAHFAGSAISEVQGETGPPSRALSNQSGDFAALVSARK